MSFALGQLIAYLKILLLAAAVMGAVWALVRFVERQGRD